MAGSGAADKEARFVAILSKLEEVFALKEQLAQQLKRGHLHLAQAKYAAAPGAVGQASYGGNLQPLISVTSSYDDSSDSLYPRFSASSARPQGDSGAEGGSSSKHNSKASGEAAGGAEARRKDSAELNNDCRPSEDQQQGAGRSRRSQQQGAAQSQQALLQMFGYLAPPALKQAQAAFAELLPSILQLANLQQRVLELAEEQEEDE
jgi:hypothetical protein